MEEEQQFKVARLNRALEGTAFAGHVHHFSVIDSTQTRALADAAAGVDGWQAYIADKQTAGRGRGGHTWHSEPERGLYMTVLVRPKLRSNDVLQISLATGIAAYRAIEIVTGFRIDLRWPNDLVVRRQGEASKKLGGILTEAGSAADGTLRHAAIGIGINLNQTEFPPELQTVATSLRLASGEPVTRERLAQHLLRELATELLLLEDADARTDRTVKETSTLFERFEAASSWVRGKRVQVAEEEGYTGLTSGLTNEGLLRVQCDDGTERIVRHGGVREAATA